MTLEFDFELAEMLEAYGAQYKQLHGVDVSAAELSIEIHRQFIAGDEAFQRFHRIELRCEQREQRAALMKHEQSTSQKDDADVAWEALARFVSCGTVIAVGCDDQGFNSSDGNAASIEPRMLRRG